MAQRDRAAIYVDLVGIEPESFDHRQRLRRKRFVQLDYIDVVERQASEFQNFRNGKHWSDSHFFRRTARGRISYEASHWLRAQLTRARVRHYYRRRSAVGHLRRIARGDRAFRMKRRF